MSKMYTKETIDLAKVYPRIKGLFDNENPDPSPTHKIEMKVSLEDSPIIKPFAKGLGVCYMLDNGDTFQILQNRHLSDELTIEKLHDAALTNMAAAISDKTEIKGDINNVMMLVNGGNFEATMLLADFVWVSIEDIVKDKVCVAIPANDLLFIAAKNNSVGRESLRNAVRHYFDNVKSNGLIVRHIYERTNEGWDQIETA